MSTVRIKTCGITRHEDARLALDLGAWAIGLIFHPLSPRSIEPEAARRLVERLPADTLSIGVFVDRPVSEVQDVVDRVGLRGVQLHGNETPEEVAAISASTVIKAFRVGEGFDPGLVDEYQCDLVLLDTFRKGKPGGTGETFDWAVAHAVADRRPTIVAGGIGPHNAIAAIDAANPFAIDVSSRVESSPGVKDHEELQRLFEIVGL